MSDGLSGGEQALDSSRRDWMISTTRSPSLSLYHDACCLDEEESDLSRDLEGEMQGWRLTSSTISSSPTTLKKPKGSCSFGSSVHEIEPFLAAGSRVSP